MTRATAASAGPAPWLGRLTPLALATVALAGAGVAVVPQHAASIARLAAATVAGVAVLIRVAGLARAWADPDPRARGRATALERRPPPPVPPIEPPGLAAARRALGEEVATGPLPLTRSAWERLTVVAVAGFARRGIDIDNPATRDEAEQSVSPAVWQALVARPPDLPAARRGGRDPDGVATTVQRILDDLDDPAPPATRRPETRRPT